MYLWTDIASVVLVGTMSFEIVDIFIAESTDVVPGRVFVVLLSSAGAPEAPIASDAEPVCLSFMLV